MLVRIRLIPVDVFVGEFAVAEFDDCHEGNFHFLTFLWVGATPGSIQGISWVCVKGKIISSTNWSVPTVREIGVSVVSGGMVGMKRCE